MTQCDNSHFHEFFTTLVVDFSARFLAVGALDERDLTTLVDFFSFTDAVVLTTRVVFLAGLLRVVAPNDFFALTLGFAFFLATDTRPDADCAEVADDLTVLDTFFVAFGNFFALGALMGSGEAHNSSRL